MNNPILQSSVKLVFVLMAVAVIALTFARIIDPKDFMTLASMAFTAHFARRDTPPTSPNDTAS